MEHHTYINYFVCFYYKHTIGWIRVLKSKKLPEPSYLKYKLVYNKFSRKLVTVNHIWAVIVLVCLAYGGYLFYAKNTTQLNAKNVVTAYYDAIDFKEFERAFSYLNPDDNVSLSQYMLEVSVTDGILSSYAKLDSIGISFVSRTKTSARVKVDTRWITPLEAVNKTYYHTVKKRKNKWYITPSKIDNDLPPDQLFIDNNTTFF